MIKNYDEKIHLEKQISRLERALLEIKEKNKNNRYLFDVFSKPYINKIQDLRAQIDEYLGISQVNTNYDLVVRVAGENIGFGQAPISVVANTLKNFKTAMLSIAKNVHGYPDVESLPSNIRSQFDLIFSGSFSGSIQLGLKMPYHQLSLFENNLEEVTTILETGLKWVSSNGSDIELEEVIPNKELRVEVLKGILKLTPSKTNNIQSLHIYGEMVSGEYRLDMNSREKIKSYFNDEEDTYQVVGIIREIDLDKKKFILRNLEENTEYKEVVCRFRKIDEVFEKEIILNHKVLVEGIYISKRKSVLNLKAIIVNENGS